MADLLVEAEVEALARALLRTELRKRNWSYARLAGALRELGIDETEASIKNKVSRGRFTFVFLLEAMMAIGVDKLVLPRSATAVRGEPIKQGRRRGSRVGATASPRGRRVP